MFEPNFLTIHDCLKRFSMIQNGRLTDGLKRVPTVAQNT